MARAKPKIGLRKPPSTAAKAAFVAGGASKASGLTAEERHERNLLRRFTIYIDPKLKAELRHLALDLRCAASTLAELALAEGLKHPDQLRARLGR